MLDTGARPHRAWTEQGRDGSDKEANLVGHHQSQGQILCVPLSPGMGAVPNFGTAESCDERCLSCMVCQLTISSEVEKGPGL